MSTSVDAAFINMYLSDVHQAYQQRGSKLRNTVRLKEKIQGAKVVFQKSGKGVAGKKTRHGNVPLMNVDHNTVDALMEDWYAAEYIDKLDEIKTNIDERLIAANAGAWALGRKIDELIITQLDKTSSVVAHGDTGLTKAKVLEAFGRLNTEDIPDDGNRFAVVGPTQWNELLDIQEFKSSDFSGEKYPWLKGTESRIWLGITWMFHSGLKESAGVRNCFVYHKSAAGLGEGQAIKAFVDWVPEKAAHLVDHMMSAGAILIDSAGVVEVQCKEAA